MQAAGARSWKEAFALAAEQAQEARRVKKQDAFFERKDQEFHDETQAREQREELAARDALMQEATPQRIEAFRSQLDDYDTRTVKALTENGEALDKVNERLGRMLDQADVLPDGRRVFKTKDGQQVFDEHGAAVSSDTINPHALNDLKEPWEGYRSTLTEKRSLETSREGLIEFQGKLDDARAQIDKGGITNGALDELDDQLKADMPEIMQPQNDDAGAMRPAGPQSSGPERRAAAQPAPG